MIEVGDVFDKLDFGVVLFMLIVRGEFVVFEIVLCCGYIVFVWVVFVCVWIVVDCLGIDLFCVEVE